MSERGTKEIAGSAIIATVNGSEQPFAFLMGIPTSPERSAGRCMDWAERFVTDSLNGNWRSNQFLRDPGIIDWTDQPEPAWDEKADQMADAFPSEEWLQHAENFRLLHKHIAAKCKPGHQLRDLFDLIEPDADQHDTNAPAPSALCRAIDIFHSTNEAEKRRILGGWSGDSARVHDRAEFMQCGDCTQLEPVLQAASIGDGSGIDWTFNTVANSGRGIAPVSLAIVAGTPKEHVELALESMKTDIEKMWKQLTTAPNAVGKAGKLS